jgi:DNA-binding transcriptional ArsR family regulator
MPVRFDKPLDEALRSWGHIRVLRVLIVKGPDENLSARAIARRAGLSHPRVAEVLADLARQGLVAAHRGLGYGLYDLNEDQIVTRVLRPLFEWEMEAADELVAYLRRAIAGRAEHVRAALLIGDLAWGEGGSDVVEVAVLTAPDREAQVWERFMTLRDRIRRRFGSDLRVMVESRRRAAEQARRGRQPWRRIADRGVPLYRTFPR